jgi:hypothetical protein
VATDVERVLGGVAPHLMVTDPPYGVSYDPAWRNRAAAQGIIGQKKASRAIGEVVNDDRADWREAWALFSGSVAYIWHAGTKAGIVQDSLAACGFETRAQIIWAKNRRRCRAWRPEAPNSKARSSTRLVRSDRMPNRHRRPKPCRSSGPLPAVFLLYQKGRDSRIFQAQDRAIDDFAHKGKTRN